MAQTGSCLCGGVRFRIEGALDPIQVCHCGQCRKAQGGPFAAVIPVLADRLVFEAGEALLQAYASSPGKERLFCRVCGSPVLSRRPALPHMVRIRAGLLDEPLAARPAFHQHTASACAWWPIDDGLPQYLGGHSRPPRDGTGD